MNIRANPNILGDIRNWLDSQSARRISYILCSILGAALLLRLAAIFSLHLFPFSDSLEYLRLGRQLADGIGYVRDDTPTAYRPPGYPFMLSALFSITGASVVSAQIMQAVVEVIQCFLIFRLGLLLSCRMVGLVGATFWAVNPISIIQSNLLMPEAIFACLFTGSLALLLSHSAGHVVRHSLVGCIWGFMALIKPFFILAPLVFVVWDLRAIRSFSHKVQNFSLIVAGMSLVVFPWVARNYALFHHPFISSNAGINIYIGNNERANGSYRSIEETALDTISDEWLRDRTAARFAAQFIASHPLKFLALLPRKFAHLFSSESPFAVYLSNPSPVALHEPYFQRYTKTPVMLHAVVNVHYFLFMMLGMIGFIFAPTELIIPFRLFLLFVALWIIVALLTFGSPRFHYPLMPLFVVASGAVLSSCTSVGSASTTRPKLAALFFISLFVAIQIAELLTGITA